MGLGSIVASGIATAKSVTSDLQPNITFEAWTGQSSTGVPTYAASVSLPALVEDKQQLVRDVSGREVMSKTKLTILQPVTATVATGRRNPIDPRDKITLPSSVPSGPILAVAGLTDKNTSAPFLLEIWLG